MIKRLWQLLVVALVPVWLATAEMQPVVVGSSSNELLSLNKGAARCEEINIPMCRGIGYNLTYMPNELNHDNQEEAGFEVHQFWPLVEIRCSNELKFFLCSMYTPICFEDYQKPLKACRGVCERARNGCAPLMRQYGFEWPERMNCEQLPVQGDDNVLCMEPPESSGGKDSSGIYGRLPNFQVTRKPSVQPKCKPGQKGKNCRDSFLVDSATPMAGSGDCTCRCKEPLVTLNRDSPWYNRSVSVGGVNNCAVPCSGLFFNEEEKEFAATWLILWAGLCSVATLMTLTTFLIDTERFKYPERPIVFLSACYLLVSVGYLVRVFVGHDEVVCEENHQMVIYNASGPKPCTLVFLLVYFFGMASNIWWVILTFTWFLAAGFKWSNEAIASYSQYFHLAAWLMPTVMSVGVLIMSAVDGDALVGICFVGNQNPNNLKIFVLIPLVIYLIIGMSFLVAGLVSLFRIRNVIKKQGTLSGRSKADKLEKLMIRIGIFSVLYTLPATVLIMCYYYEYNFYNDWMTSQVCPCSADTYRQSKIRSSKPVYQLMMLKHFMALAVGITSGVWIWSGKTVGSWKKLWKRLFGNGKSHKPTALINNAGKTRLQPTKQQQYMSPPSIPIPPVPTSSSTLLSGPHINPGAGNLPAFMNHHPANLHHHVIKQSQQAPLSHV